MSVPRGTSAERRPARPPGRAVARAQGRAIARCGGIARLVDVRVRLLELRLLAVGLAVLWAIVAVLLLVGYRPGGPADLLVGLAALAPLSVAVAAVAWPPAARGGVAFRTIVALGVATIIILLPTLAGLVRQLVDQGLQTMLPSPEAGYAWVLAILGTSLFAGLGISRRVLGPESGRRGRLGASIALGIGLAVVSATVMAGATIANELALRDRPAAESRYGPTDTTRLPPPCDAPLVAGPTAQLTLDLGGTIDLKSLGSARIRGERSARDFRWLGEVTTTRQIGFAGAALVGDRGFVREPGTRWLEVPAGAAASESLDLAIIGAALDPLQRTAAEDLGLVYVEGARARRCRIAVDGPTFRKAFPQVRWLVGAADLTDWRGEIDVWVFTDGQVGRVEGRLGGGGFAIDPDAIRGELRTALTATHRGVPVSVAAPTN